MRLEDQKEQFSYAYVHAVVTLAGFIVIPYPRLMDNQGLDLQIAAMGNRDLPREPRLDVQVKCTGRDVLGEQHLAFPLEVAHYDRLRSTETGNHHILVVVYVPADPRLWLAHSEEEMIMRHCGYWCNLRGEPATENTRTITVRLPRAQQFTPNALRALMERIDQGGRP